MLRRTQARFAFAKEFIEEKKNKEIEEISDTLFLLFFFG